MQSKKISQVIVIGSINTDLVACVADLPCRGETVPALDFQEHLGGKGANQAAATALLGAEVTMVGCVGDDAAGVQALERLDRVRVNRSLVRKVPRVPTGTALITVGEQGENTIVVVPGANAELKKSDVEAVAKELACADAVILQLEIPDDVVRATTAALQGIRARQGRPRPWLVFNPSPFRPSALPPCDSVDLLLVNELEAEAMSGVEVSDPKSAARAAGKLLSDLRRGGCVVITLGAQGAVALAEAGGSFTGKEDLLLYAPALKVNAVDSTGAGDVFTGGFVSQVTVGRSLGEALRFATAAAAITVTRAGAQSSFPTKTEVERMVSRVEKPRSFSL